METYCVNCKNKYCEQYSSLRRTRQNRLILISNSSAYSKWKSGFIKNQETNRLELQQYSTYSIIFEMNTLI